ncbi:MAG: hypothetical protein U9M95_06800 [Candidatus Altiarchaeota archaeon]|nr:hypothetical protein [Candidatus Altiarchaeota archaeon]
MDHGRGITVWLINITATLVIMLMLTGCMFEKQTRVHASTQQKTDIENRTTGFGEKINLTNEPLENELNSTNESLDETPDPANEAVNNTLLMFHNNLGPMCLEMLKWLESTKTEHPSLTVEEHITTDSGTRQLMNQLIAEYGASGGISKNFRYLPITFYRGEAFSGFNKEVQTRLQKLMGS